MKSRELSTIAVLIGMYCSSRFCPPQDLVLVTIYLYSNGIHAKYFCSSRVVEEVVKKRRDLEPAKHPAVAVKDGRRMVREGRRMVRDPPLGLSSVLFVGETLPSMYFYLS